MPELTGRRAAQYVRMSSDTQNLSPGMQKQAIRDYADAWGLTIVASYEDEARSGLTLRGRAGMRSLLADVARDECPFSVILVYDVSRWGRFQDADESAYYDYHCRVHGVEVVYVTEPFDGQRTTTSAILKALKRSMAAEFSRELAVKVTAAQHAAVTLGFQIGRTPCIGIDRVAVSPGGVRRALNHGERTRKGERVAWVRGPETEIQLIERIYREYATTDITLARLAAKLNAEGHSARGAPFTLTMVRCLLESEIYYGEFVWGLRKGRALPDRRTAGDPAVVRCGNVIAPIISRQLWDAVQAKRDRARHVFHRDSDSLLQDLKIAIQQTPGLARTDMSGHRCGPLNKYREAFGSIRQAMQLAGRDEAAMQAEYLRRKVRAHRLAAKFGSDFRALLNGAGLECWSLPREQVLTVCDAVRLRFRLIWRREHRLGPRWFLPNVPPAYCDHVLIVLMEEDDTARELLLMTTAQYRGLRSGFAEGGSVGEQRLFSGHDLVDQVRRLVSNARLQQGAHL